MRRCGDGAYDISAWRGAEAEGSPGARVEGVSSRGLSASERLGVTAPRAPEVLRDAADSQVISFGTKSNGSGGSGSAAAAGKGSGKGNGSGGSGASSSSRGFEQKKRLVIMDEVDGTRRATRTAAVTSQLVVQRPDSDAPRRPHGRGRRHVGQLGPRRHAGADRRHQEVEGAVHLHLQRPPEHQGGCDEGCDEEERASRERSRDTTVTASRWRHPIRMWHAACRLPSHSLSSLSAGEGPRELVLRPARAAPDQERRREAARRHRARRGARARGERGRGTRGGGLREEEGGGRRDWCRHRRYATTVWRPTE